MASPDSQTIELDREYLATVTFQGREYQKYSIDHRTYFGPVDEEEAERLEDEQQVFQRIFDNRLIFPPIRRLRRVLDCGHGSASWAVEVAEQNPSCEVIGVDIAPHMNPDDMPDNLWLQVDDLNRRFTFPTNHFDLVHSRLLATGIHRARWPSYLRDIVSVLKPGGWVQMVEIYFNVQSDNGSLTDDHALRRWSTHYLRALEDRKDLRIGSKLRTLMTEAGFVEVDTKMIPLPLSAWSNDARMRNIGRSNHENIKQLLRSLALYPLIQRLHMSPQNFEALVTQAQREAADHTLKPYFPLYVCIGRKP
ncbi:hypothetical protein PENARI_c007G04567 [Penicillium arizonense]|uniref:Methyltransferase domain-containing protein n=1 Tax=Penicillium arizonense TaxID=1835702 RepID=A0A1F5LJX7_PENAI|nr:hypothetical protein PENARI_c007G04567 [Penicillium arizonense]OGE53513.1 hypothetical protein PENARI_c007G04567 [Penicillium arizonense]